MLPLQTTHPMNDRTTQRVVDSITRALLGLIDSRPCPLDDLVEQYLADRAHEVTPRHHQQTRVRLHSLIADQRVRAEALGLPALADAMDLRVDLLDRWQVEQLDAGWARQTVRQYLAHLKAVTRWGYRKGLLEADPLATLELPSANRRQQKRPRGPVTLQGGGPMSASSCTCDRCWAEYPHGWLRYFDRVGSSYLSADSALLCPRCALSAVRDGYIYPSPRAAGEQLEAVLRANPRGLVGEGAKTRDLFLRPGRLTAALESLGVRHAG